MWVFPVNRRQYTHKINNSTFPIIRISKQNVFYLSTPTHVIYVNEEWMRKSILCYTSAEAHFSPQQKKSEWAMKGLLSLHNPLHPVHNPHTSIKNEIFKAIHWTWQSVAAYNQNIKTSLRENAVFRSFILYAFTIKLFVYNILSPLSSLFWCWTITTTTAQ